jgi:hypothetical protein
VRPVASQETQVQGAVEMDLEPTFLTGHLDLSVNL